MGAKGEQEVTTKLPKGFEIVPDERLPEGNVADHPTYNVDIDPDTGGPRELITDGPEGEPLSLEDQESLPSPPEGQFYDEYGQLHLDDAGLPEGFEVTDETADLPQDEAPEQPQQAPIGAGSAAWRGLQSNALFGFDDELAAASGMVGNKIGTALGMNESTASAKEIYDQILQQQRDEKDAAFDQHPIAYGAGALPGMVISAPLIGGKLAQGGGVLRNTLSLAGAGARGGAASGAGNNEGDLGDLVGNIAEGAAVGGIAAPLAQPLVSGVARGAGAIRNAVMPRNTMNSGLDVLSRGMGDDVAGQAATMRATADEMQASGVDPRLVDVVDESGRGTIRAAGSRQTPARDDLARHADEVYASAQGRVANQAQRISSAPGTARGVVRRVEEEQAAMGPQFDAVREEPVTLTPDLIQAFSTAEGRSVLRTIGRYMGPTEREQLDGFVSAVNAAARQIDPRLPEGIRQQIQTQLFRDTPLTVDIADKFARVITNRAQDNPALMRVARQYADTVRGAARQQYPSYDEALEAFSARARVGDAAGGTGRFEGTEFMRTPPDEYAANIAQANREPAAIMDELGNPTASEAAAIQQRARDDVVDQATAGSGAGAMRVASTLSRGDAQAARNAALLGDEEAQALQAGMANEVRRVDNTRFIDPRTGSQTQSRGQDAAELGMDVAMNAASGGKWAAVRAATQFIRMAGVRGVDAERLVRDAIDPARTRDAINFLEQRGMERARARSLMRSIAATLGGRLGGANSYDNPEQPRSGRSIINSSRRVEKGEDQ